jgi:hypothetical protein
MFVREGVGQLRTYDIKSVPSYVSQVDRLMESWGAYPGDLWFRGVNNVANKPVPGLTWRDIKDEESVISQFLISFRGLFDGQLEGPWERYALMQHFGLPTRLLDWTGSPLLALYFALFGSERSGGTRAVWVLDPFELNRRAVDRFEIPLAGHSTPDSWLDLDDYLPKTLNPKNDKPLPPNAIAIDVPFSNRRIIAQQGCFTVHGSWPVAIDRQIKAGGSVDKHLALLRIRGRARSERMLASLRNLGFREETVFPDLRNLSERIVREER